MPKTYERVMFFTNGIIYHGYCIKDRQATTWHMNGCHKRLDQVSHWMPEIDLPTLWVDDDD